MPKTKYALIAEHGLIFLRAPRETSGAYGPRAFFSILNKLSPEERPRYTRILSDMRGVRTADLVDSDRAKFRHYEQLLQSLNLEFTQLKIACIVGPETAKTAIERLKRWPRYYQEFQICLSVREALEALELPALLELPTKLKPVD